jgi:hypothetical protein
MRLYARNEPKNWAWIDNIIIYTATVYPMLYWFLSAPRKFNWFVENEFFRFQNPFLITFLSWIYGFILVFYIVRTSCLAFKNKSFNIPKNAIIVGTILSWYFGIVYFNNDLIFTLLNVVSHGIPYIALIYLKEIDKKPASELNWLHYFKHFKGLLLFLAILIFIAFSEEYLWEILVWNEQFSGTAKDFSNWYFLVVPLLTVPQFTHYLLDGFIWKNNKQI